jgi:hypothetical protein
MSQKHCDRDLTTRSPTWRSRKVIILAMLFSAAISGCGKQAFAPLPAHASTPSVADVVEVHKLTQSVALGSSEVDHSAAKPLTVAELVKLAGDPCKTSLQNAHCMSEESDFELIPDCSAHGYYAAVKNTRGTELLSKVPPQNNIIRSVLSQGQLVCVQAVAWIKKYPSYLFVTAVPNAEQNSCPGCKQYGGHRIEWRVPHVAGPCVETALGRFEGGCAVGWVDGDDMELLGNLK